MKYSGSLVKIEREKIFSLFLTKEKLKFSDIEKSLDIRSNMVSYHLTQMTKEKILRKKNDFYELTEQGEKYLPIFSHVTGREIGPVPVILVAVTKKGKNAKEKMQKKKEDSLFLIKRKNRPYKDYWSLIGGKLKLHESFDDASIRLVKEKTGFDSKFISLNAILHEKVHGEEVKHSFILFFTKVEIDESKTVKKSETGTWFSEKQLNKEEIIPSDYWLLKNKLNKKLAVFVADMNDKEGKMKDFKVKNVNKIKY